MPNTEIQCPNCGSFATRPRATSWWQREKLSASYWMEADGFGRKRGATFENPKWVQAFQARKIGAVCDTCKYEFDTDTPARARSSSAANVATEKRTLAERLKDLVELRTAGLITEDEFRQKREDILRGL
jgi:hypothetical protein